MNAAVIFRNDSGILGFGELFDVKDTWHLIDGLMYIALNVISTKQKVRKKTSYLEIVITHFFAAWIWGGGGTPY